MPSEVKCYVQGNTRHDVLAVLERDTALFQAFQHSLPLALNPSPRLQPCAVLGMWPPTSAS